MPTYEYACTSCGEHHDVVQSFHDDPLTTCPACGGPLRKVFGSIGVVFKGSGFYKNDSRPTGKNGDAPKTAATESKSSEASAPATTSTGTTSSDSTPSSGKKGGDKKSSGGDAPKAAPAASSSGASKKAAAS